MNSNVVSLSGGKDSTAMLLRMLELGEPIDKIVFADTRKEFPEHYDYLDLLEDRLGIEIERLHGENSWEKWFYGKFTRGRHEGERRGFPYVAYPCWAMREMKFKPLQKAGNGGNMCIGFGLDEPDRWGKKTYQDQNYRFPLVEWGWTEADCMKYVKKKGLYNRLYDDFPRLGCFCCPKQPLKNLHIIKEKWPDLWEKMIKMEDDSPGGFRPDITLSDDPKGFCKVCKYEI